jgi:hypothetical protein
MTNLMLGDGPNTFIRWWTVKELRDWFNEQEYRSRECPGIYTSSLWWRDWIAEEMRRRRLKNAPISLTRHQLRHRAAKAKKTSTTNFHGFTKITVYHNGMTKTV